MCKKIITTALLFITVFSGHASVLSADTDAGQSRAYKVGVDDVLAISVLRPEQLDIETIVAPDGAITFPYIGTVFVEGLTVDEIKSEIERRLREGYMKYPVVTVYLQESRSRKVFIYGEVAKPGAYPLTEGLSVVKAISIAGGFTKFGSSSSVRILRPKKSGGSEMIKVDIRSALGGDVEADLPVRDKDTVVVLESFL